MHLINIYKEEKEKKPIKSKGYHLIYLSKNIDLIKKDISLFKVTYFNILVKRDDTVMHIYFRYQRGSAYKPKLKTLPSLNS